MNLSKGIIYSFISNVVTTHNEETDDDVKLSKLFRAVCVSVKETAKKIERDGYVIYESNVYKVPVSGDLKFKITGIAAKEIKREISLNHKVKHFIKHLPEAVSKINRPRLDIADQALVKDTYSRAMNTLKNLELIDVPNLTLTVVSVTPAMDVLTSTVCSTSIESNFLDSITHTPENAYFINNVCYYSGAVERLICNSLQKELQVSGIN